MTRFELLTCLCRTLEGSIFFEGQPVPVLRSPVLAVAAENLPAVLVTVPSEEGEPITSGTCYQSTVQVHLDVRMTSCPLSDDPEQDWDLRSMALAQAVVTKLLATAAFLRAWQPKSLRFSRRTYADAQSGETMICGEVMTVSGVLQPQSYGLDDLALLQAFGITLDTAESGWDGLPEIEILSSEKE